MPEKGRAKRSPLGHRPVLPLGPDRATWAGGAQAAPTRRAAGHRYGLGVERWASQSAARGQS